MSAQELLALIVFSTAIAFTPGPNTTLSAALAANGGMRQALRFILAVPVGWGLLLLASVAGLGTLVQAAPVLRGLIKAAGLAYMLWLA
ncbi:MAG: LysE family transporter, partial [Rubrivivax sp.]